MSKDKVRVLKNFPEYGLKAGAVYEVTEWYGTDPVVENPSGYLTGLCKGEYELLEEEPEPQYADFNVNSNVKIKPTDRGWVVYWHYMNDWKTPRLHGITSMHETKAEADAEGYLRMAAWKAMEIFGPKIHLGGPLLFEPTIKVKR